MSTSNYDLSKMHRPNLLVRASRIALDGYNRAAAIRRIFGDMVSPSEDGVFEKLAEQEDFMNTQRKTGDVTYNIARHILVLTALIHESQRCSQ